MRISDWSSDVCSSDLARAGDDVVDLPVITVTQAAALWDGSGSEESTPLLTDEIESLAHDLLTDTHAGWENNDGAYGEFVFDVANRTNHIAHNDSDTSVDNYKHVGSGANGGTVHTTVHLLGKEKGGGGGGK